VFVWARSGDIYTGGWEDDQKFGRATFLRARKNVLRTFASSWNDRGGDSTQHGRVRKARNRKD